MEWILRHLVFWDLFYEHCSMFHEPHRWQRHSSSLVSTFCVHGTCSRGNISGWKADQRAASFEHTRMLAMLSNWRSDSVPLKNGWARGGARRWLVPWT